jgi:hypothetical protein
MNRISDNNIIHLIVFLDEYGTIYEYNRGNG